MQDRRVIVVNVDGIGDDVDAVLVGLPVGRSPFDPGAGQEGGERLGVVVAALGPGRVGPRRAAELGADGQQRLVEQAALLQVRIRRRARWSTRRALGRWSCMLPCASQLLLEPVSISSTTRTPALDQAACDEALAARTTSCRRSRRRTVAASRRFRADDRGPRGPRASCPGRCRSSSCRAGRLRSSGRAAACSSLTSRSISCSSSCSVTDAGRGCKLGIGSVAGHDAHALVDGGRKLLSQTCEPA